MSERGNERNEWARLGPSNCCELTGSSFLYGHEAANYSQAIRKKNS